MGRTSRRGFLIGLGAALAAPAIVKADSLMKLYVPPKPKLIADGLDDYIEGYIYQNSRRVGQYQKIGKLVHFSIVIEAGRNETVGQTSVRTFRHHLGFDGLKTLETVRWEPVRLSSLPPPTP